MEKMKLTKFQDKINNIHNNRKIPFKTFPNVAFKNSIGWKCYLN